MKWQPVMLVADHRVECACGTLAIFVMLDEQTSDDGERDFGYTVWCQDCFKSAQEAED